LDGSCRKKGGEDVNGNRITGNIDSNNIVSDDINNSVNDDDNKPATSAMTATAKSLTATINFVNISIENRTCGFDDGQNKVVDDGYNGNNNKMKLGVKNKIWRWVHWLSNRGCASSNRTLRCCLLLRSGKFGRGVWGGE
jgi:hypothetical protein